MSKKTITVNWVVGDISYDGHGRVDYCLIDVTYDPNKAPDGLLSYLESIEDRAIQQSGVDFSKWFVDYQDNTISPEDVKKLQEYGVIFNENNWDDPRASDKYIVFNGDDYFHIWKQLIMLTDSGVEISQALVPEYIPKADGYGLFDN